MLTARIIQEAMWNVPPHRHHEPLSFDLRRYCDIAGIATLEELHAAPELSAQVNFIMFDLGEGNGISLELVPHSPQNPHYLVHLTDADSAEKIAERDAFYARSAEAVAAAHAAASEPPPADPASGGAATEF